MGLILVIFLQNWQLHIFLGSNNHNHRDLHHHSIAQHSQSFQQLHCFLPYLHIKDLTFIVKASSIISPFICVSGRILCSSPNIIWCSITISCSWLKLAKCLLDFRGILNRYLWSSFFGRKYLIIEIVEILSIVTVKVEPPVTDEIVLVEDGAIWAEEVDLSESCSCWASHNTNMKHLTSSVHICIHPSLNLNKGQNTKKENGNNHQTLSSQEKSRNGMADKIG